MVYGWAGGICSCRQKQWGVLQEAACIPIFLGGMVGVLEDGVEGVSWKEVENGESLETQVYLV